LKSYGTTEKTSIGRVLATAGDLTYDLVVVLEGEVECSDIHDGRRRALLVHGSRDFIAELDLMTGQRLYANFVVIEAGSIIRVPRSSVKAIIETEVTLGELLVQTLFRRREALLLLRSGIPNTTRDAGFEQAAGTTIVNSTRASPPQIAISASGAGGQATGRRRRTRREGAKP
jgi:CRP-like cAMP-binding protein